MKISVRISKPKSINATVRSYSGSGRKRRDIENISGMAVIMCEGKVSRGVYNDVLLLTNNATGYVVGKAEIIEIEEES